MNGGDKMFELRSIDGAPDSDELLAPHISALRRLALRLTASHCDAEDLLQGVRLKLHVHRFRLPHVQDLRPWLYRVMYYEFLDQTRQARKFPAVALDTVDTDTIERGLRTWACGEEGERFDELTGPELCAFRMQLKDFIDMALDQLAPLQRQAVALHDLEGLSLPEIAQHCAVPLNTLKAALTRARAVLRERLSEFDVLHARLSTRRRAVAMRRAHGRSAYRRMRRRGAGSGGDQQNL